MALINWCLALIAATSGAAPAKTPSPPSGAASPAAQGTPSPKTAHAIPQGWLPSLRGALGVSFNQSSGVVGVPDGLAFSLGLQITGIVLWRRGPNEWESRLELIHAQTKSAKLRRFVKSADRLFISTAFLHFFRPVPWLGLYAGIRLSSELFPGRLVREKDTRVGIPYAGGVTVVHQVPAQTPFRMTGAWLPLIFRQSAGLAARPVTRPDLWLDLKLGVGAAQVWTGAGLVANNKKRTTAIFELEQLRDHVQGYVELRAALEGSLWKKTFTYRLLAELSYPFAKNVSTTLAPRDLLHGEFRLDLAIRIAKWLAVTYVVGVVRFPLLVPRWQINSNLQLSFTMDLER